MAVAVDTTNSPAAFTVPDATAPTTAGTSAAFSPGASTVLAVAFSANTATGSATAITPTVTNSGTALTWTVAIKRDPSNGFDGLAGVAWAVNANAQTNITISMSYTGASNGARMVKCFVLTGCDTSTPVVATNFAETKTATSMPVSATNGAQAGGLLVSSYLDWNATAAPTMSNGTLESPYAPSGLITANIGRVVATSASTSYTANWTGAATLDGHTVAAIFQAAGGGAANPPPPRAVTHVPRIRAAHF